MYKLSWNPINDKGHKTFIILPDVHALYDTYHVITGYGRRDGCIPVNIKITNLDGDIIDITEGLACVAGQGTYSSRNQ